MRVLHLVKTSVGAWWALRQMRELLGLGVDVHVALPPDGPLVHQYEAAGVVVHAVQTGCPTPRPWRCPAVFAQLRSLVSSVSPDIIHSHFVGTTVSVRLALGRNHAVPRIFQVPGPLHLEHGPFRQAELVTAGPSDYWIGSCNWTCERYRQSGVAEDRLFLSYYGADVCDFTGQSPGKLRAELGVDAATRIVGMVAFMYPPKRYLGQARGIKGHEDLIDAIAICLESDPRVLGVFVGGAWDGANVYENRIRRYGEKRCGGRVVFLGTRDDVAELYPDFDVAVHPSHSENVGGAVQSLLSGVPTIATRVGGFPDLVRHGDTGLLVPPRDPPKLAEAVLEILRNPVYAREMASRGRIKAKEQFDVKETARQVMTIYQSVRARHGRQEA